jgi:lysozyme
MISSPLQKKKMQTSDEGKKLIKKFEGCKMRAYLDVVNVPTIAYGRTKNVKLGDTCTQGQAEEWLEEELIEYEGYVNEAVKVPLTQNQLDALVSWTYNLGPSNLNKSTHVKGAKQLRLRRRSRANYAMEQSRWKSIRWVSAKERS